MKGLLKSEQRLVRNRHKPFPLYDSPFYISITTMEINSDRSKGYLLGLKDLLEELDRIIPDSQTCPEK